MLGSHVVFLYVSKNETRSFLFLSSDTVLQFLLFFLQNESLCFFILLPILIKCPVFLSKF